MMQVALRATGTSTQQNVYKKYNFLEKHRFLQKFCNSLATEFPSLATEFPKKRQS